MALAMDFMAIALSELANISERRIERMVNGALSYGLPRFLTNKGGLNSGLMIAQYTAASLVSENKVLAHPASVDSIPTSANQEDHNSMGSIAAQKCFKVLKNVENVRISFLKSIYGNIYLAILGAMGEPGNTVKVLDDKGKNLGVYKVLDSTTGQVLKSITKVKGNSLYDLYIFDKKI